MSAPSNVDFKALEALAKAVKEQELVAVKCRECSCGQFHKPGQPPKTCNFCHKIFQPLYK